jgi:hypothetical protein
MRMAAGRKKEKGGQGVEPCLRIGLFFYSCKIRLQLAYWERVEKNPDFSRYTIAFEKEKNGVYIHYNMYTIHFLLFSERTQACLRCVGFGSISFSYIRGDEDEGSTERNSTLAVCEKI